MVIFTLTTNPVWSVKYHILLVNGVFKVLETINGKVPIILEFVWFLAIKVLGKKLDGRELVKLCFGIQLCRLKKMDLKTQIISKNFVQKASQTLRLLINKLILFHKMEIWILIQKQDRLNGQDLLFRRIPNLHQSFCLKNMWQALSGVNLMANLTLTYPKFKVTANWENGISMKSIAELKDSYLLPVQF